MATLDLQQILMGKPNQLDYATQTDQSALQRKRRMVQALLQSAMERTSPLIDTGAIKVANWGDALGKIFEAYAAREGRKDVEGEEQAVARAQQQRHSDAAAQFNRDASGYTIEPEGPPKETGPKEHIVGDMRRAILNAVQSSDPQIAALGSKGMEEIFKKMLSEKERLPGTETVEGVNVVRDPMTGKVINKEAISQYGPVSPASPSMPAGQANLATGKFNAMGTGQLAVPTPGKTFGADIEKADAKILSEGREKANTAWDGLKLLSTVTGIMSKMSPTSFGKLSDLKVFANQLSSSLGFAGVPEGASIEMVNALMGERLLERLRMFAPVSDSDVKNMQKIAGSAGNTQQALQGIIQYAESVFARGIQNQNDYAEGLERDKPEYGPLDRFKSYRSVVGPVPDGLGAPPPVDLKKYWKNK